MSSTDWDSVTVLRKRPQSVNPQVVRTEAALNAARRSGAQIVTEKKTGGGYDAAKMGKIENETEDFSVPKVSLTVSKAIQQARAAKGLTQKDLATKINEKQTVVNEYEAGKAVNPNPQILGKMERVLGVKLRGQNIGAPLGGR
ncbi:multiprotein-bridging factor 1 [Entophlyctis luteolus]|nr:multiprotein-bridging factor 1 [Entophlyctis luteolus]KAJ3390342.1 multiprotein-bridging factor 1 [Entophlyctis sp. JEL0112]